MDDLISRQEAIDALDKIFPADPMRDDYTQGITCGAALANIYVAQLPSVQPETHEERTETHACDLISRQAAIEAIRASTQKYTGFMEMEMYTDDDAVEAIINLPSAQPERLTDDDFETIRIHLNAYKEKLCNQHRWEEANEYQRILDRFMAFASAQPELIRINLNEPIKVKLTDWGKEIYYHQYDRTNQIAGREICKPMFPREDENGYTEFQLWCFIELYGMHMGMTLPNVIEPLEIVYER